MPKPTLEVNALGDALILTAVTKTLRKQGIETSVRVSDQARSLIENSGATILPNDSAPDTMNPAIRIEGYLDNDVHASPLPSLRHKDPNDIPRRNQAGQELGHLSQWMAVYVAEKLGLEPFPVDPANVKIELSPNQLREGQRYLAQLTQNEKPVVVVAANAGSQNKILPPSLIAEIQAQVGNEVQLVLLDPLPKADVIEGFDQLDLPHIQVSIEMLPGVLGAAAVVVSADSGPFHMAAAVRQGSQASAATLGMRLSPKEVILVAGSSNPLSVIYEGNQFVTPPANVCQVIPCGQHGYGETSKERLGGNQLYTIGNSKAGCIYDDYTETGLARCMKSISAADITTKIRESLA